MGQRVKKDKVNVQKERLKVIFNNMLETNIAIMNFQLTLAEKPEEIKGLKKFIRESEKAKEIINSIVHYEILVSLYNSFVNGKETYFATLCKVINRNDTIKKWDRTEKGFKLFLKLESAAKLQAKTEYEKQKEQQEILKKAKEEGKKVEFTYENGKLKPIIVGEKAN